MCGRFTLTSNDRRRLGERFGAEMPETGGLERFNVAPTEEIIAVGLDKEGTARRAELVRWGLVPGYAKEVPGGAPLINARTESVTSKPAFKGLVGRADRRCLIPADGFFEWLRSEDRKAKPVPFHFRRADGEPFAFAGLWSFTKLDEAWLISATILTTEPNELVARVHDRMPVILPGPEAEALWLSPQLAESDVLELCRPLDAGLMTVAPANPAVNKAGIDESPELLAVPAAAEETLF
jgi:putative SOS response-associated peptidase YedK